MLGTLVLAAVAAVTFHTGHEPRGAFAREAPSVVALALLVTLSSLLSGAIAAIGIAAGFYTAGALTRHARSRQVAAHSHRRALLHAGSLLAGAAGLAAGFLH